MSHSKDKKVKLRLVDSTLGANFGYSQQQINSIIIQHNNEAMLYLQEENIPKAYACLSQATTTINRFPMPQDIHRKLRALTLNGWACYFNLKKQHKEALGFINDAIRLEEKGDDRVALARTYLNKCVILSQTDEHAQALSMAELAIALLKQQKQHLGSNKKRKLQLGQTFILSFYNIAAEFEHMKKSQEALQAYKNGYEICRELMGERHKLSELMRKNLRAVRHKSKQQTQSVASNMPSVLGRTKRVRTIEVPFYGSRTEKRKKTHGKRTATEVTEGQMLRDRMILSQPQNYLPYKQVRQRIIQLYSDFDSSETELYNKELERIKKIYLPPANQNSTLNRESTPRKNSPNSPQKNSIRKIKAYSSTGEQSSTSKTAKSVDNKSFILAEEQSVIHANELRKSMVRRTEEQAAKESPPSVVKEEREIQNTKMLKLPAVETNTIKTEQVRLKAEKKQECALI